MADLPEGKPFDPDDIDDRPGPAEPARGLHLDPLRRGGGDPAGRQPADDASRVEDRKPRTIGFGGTLSTIDGVGVAGLLAAPQPLRPRRAPALRRQRRRARRLAQPRRLRLQRRRHLHQARGLDAGHQLHHLADRRSGSTSTPTASGRSPRPPASRSSSASDLTGEIFAARLARPLRRRLRHPALHASSSLIGRGAYDRRDEPLDATRGYYLAAEVNPFYEAEYGNAAIRGTLEGRVYKGFGAAGQGRARRPRARSAATSAPSVEQSPPDLLFFAGGGGSIRGYAYHSIGVESIAGARRGAVRGRRQGPGRGLGRAALPDQPELGRRRLRRLAASSPQNPTSSGDSDWRTGVGLGVRYFTSIGVLRGDLATPVNPRPGDSPRRALHRHRAGVLRRLARSAWRCSCSSRSPRWRRTQATPDSDNGFLINLLQNRLSAPGRQIQLSGVSGALSSRARIAAHHHLRRQGPVAADRQCRARLEPARAAARPGRRQPPARRAHRLAAPRRDPAAAARLPHAEAQALRAARAAGLDQPRRAPARPRQLRRAGLRPGRRALSVTGALSLAGGALDTTLDVKRLDAPGRRARAQGRLLQPTRQLDIDLALQEPQGGVVATLLKIEGAPGDRPRGSRAPARSTRST